MDHYQDKWNFPPNPGNSFVWPPPQPKVPTQEEINEFYKLLEKAREYDRKHNEPDCEIEEKKESLRRIAKQLGIEIQFP